MPPEPAAEQVDRAVERPRRRLRRLAEERSESGLFWDAPEGERPHVQAGNIDLSGEAPPASLPRVGAPFRFQWRAGPTDAKAPEPSLEPVAASESASGSGGSARPQEGSSIGDGLETEAVELLSSPPLQAQRVPEDLGRRPGDLESHSSPARRRLPQSFASQPSAASMLPVLEIPESDRPDLAAVLIDEGTEEEELPGAPPAGACRVSSRHGSRTVAISRLRTTSSYSNWTRAPAAVRRGQRRSVSSKASSQRFLCRK